MANLTMDQLELEVRENVRAALTEDVGTGDITAQLIPADQHAHARVITREDAVICGVAWVTEVFRQVESATEVTWHVADGDRVSANQVLFEVKGSARALLTGERAALNFMQTLSAVATRSAFYADKVKDLPVKLLDTRKTLPGLRLAQKYAVTCGGCHNHRIGLYDVFLIKENHITACGGIAAAVDAARRIAPEKPIEVEVESLEEFAQALQTSANIVMLDDLSLEDMRTAVRINNGQVKLEASGGINDETLRAIAETGVDFISLGTLTKNIKAIDLSMRLVS